MMVLKWDEKVNTWCSIKNNGCHPYYYIKVRVLNWQNKSVY